MSSTQKAYILQISQLGLPKGYKNNREIVVSYVTLFTELHQYIQVLYGLQDYHLWSFENDLRHSTRRAIPDELHDDMDLDLVDQVVRANQSILSSYISTTYKKMYYNSYDFGLGSQWKIEYKGLHTIDVGQKCLCIKYEGFPLIEDLIIEEQIELMNIYHNNQRDELAEYDDQRSTREEFEKYISPAMQKPNLTSINETLKAMKPLKILGL